MTITTRGGKQTIDRPMSCNEKKVKKDTDKVVDVDAELEDHTAKDAEKDQGWQISVFYKNVEETFYQCPFGRSFRTNARLRQVYERSGQKEKIGHF